MELFFIVDALKRSGAKTITAVVPYLGYQRQDHIFRDGEAVSLDVVIHALETSGTTRAIVCDLHSIKIPELFKIPVTHVSALLLFAEEIKKNNWNTDDSVLVTPDMGGIRRIKIISELLDNMPYVAIVKNRDLETGEVTASKIQGEVERRAIIVDDMISSGATIATAAQLLKKNGAEKIYVFATHPVFSDDASKLLQESPVEQVFVTDSIYIPREKHFSKLGALSIAEILASQIRSGLTHDE